MERFDAVVAGCGVSGLASGILLAERGRRVLILDQGRIPGGLLQRFRRKGIHFETGFHYVGGAGEGGPLRRYLRRLGVLDRIRLVPMDPEGFDEVHLPGRRVALPQGVDRVRDRLASEFPGDRAGVDRYFERLEAAVASHDLVSFRNDRLAPPPVAREAPVSLESVLRETVRDPSLAAVLASHGVLYGVPASRSQFDAHALITSSYYHSSHGVEGGGDALAAAFVERFRELGGVIRLGDGVRDVELEGRRVRKVVTDAGEALEPGTLVWSAHPRELLGRIRGAPIPARHSRRIEALKDTHAAFLVHAVARGVPAVEGRRNRFWFREPGDALEDAGPWLGSPKGPARVAILPGLPLPETPGDTVFQACAPVLVGELEETLSGPAREAWKMGVARSLVPIVEACVPAWAGRIEIVNVSTPRSMVKFVRSPGGSCYGIESSVHSYGLAKFPWSLGTAGLVLVGQSLGLPGVCGAIVSAFLGVGAMEGRLPDLYLELREGRPIIPPRVEGPRGGSAA